MATEFMESFPGTPLFVNRLTAKRLGHTVRAIPTLLERTYPGIRPTFAVRHEGPYGEDMVHEGFFVCRRKIELPSDDPVANPMARETLLDSTLFIGVNGVLGACALVPDRATGEMTYEDIILDADMMMEYDAEADYQNGRLSPLRDRYNTRALGRAVTFFADRYGILDALIPHASQDQPGPEYDTTNPPRPVS